METSEGKLLAFTNNAGIYLVEDDVLKNVFISDEQIRFKSASNFPPYGILISSSDNNWILNNQNILSPLKEKFTVRVNQRSRRFKNSFDLQYDQRRQIMYGGNNYNYYVNEVTVDDSFKINSITCQVKALYLEGSTNKLYVGNDKGIFIWKENKMIPVLEDISFINNVSSLYGDSTHLWIGTESNGLFTYNYQDSTIHQITDASYIRRIRPDTDSTLLIASNEGILVVDSTQELQRYNLEDGLFTNEIQDVHYDGKQYIYVANSEGLQRLDRFKVYESTVSEEDLKYTQIIVNQKKIPITDKLDLAYNENDLEIRYHLLSFASDGNIKYRTRLEPLEDEWRVGDDRVSNYLNLNPGQYAFYLQAEDIYGNKFDIPPLEIYIRKAYWQTIWFRGGVVIVLLASVITYLVTWKKRQRQKIDQLNIFNRKIADLELSALRAQMNPHFVFNALGAIQYYIQTNEVDTADSYLTCFAQLVRGYLNSSREKVITLEKEVDLLRIYTELEQMRFEGQFNVRIQVDENLSLREYDIPSMLIQPFVENAINHGLSERKDGKASLLIHFYSQNKKLYCKIQDNGIGRINAKKKRRKGHRSKGMNIVDDKIEVLRKSGISDISVQVEDLDTSEQQYPGTIVLIEIRNLEEE
ncbi:MAG: histidine kinase [Bacteroidota bacterium]